MDRCPRVVMSLPESDAESYSSSHDPSPTLQIDSAAVRLVVETTAQSSSTTLSVTSRLHRINITTCMVYLVFVIYHVLHVKRFTYVFFLYLTYRF